MYIIFSSIERRLNFEEFYLKKRYLSFFYFESSFEEIVLEFWMERKYQKNLKFVIQCVLATPSFLSQTRARITEGALFSFPLS